ALDDFLHGYNYHRCHTALGGQPPISRVNNAAGQYN
ncbi:IS481 family transposase, partial [Streptomyces sp. NPDC088254]